MNNIIIAGHEDFPKGLQKTGTFITGEESNVTICQLFSNESPKMYKDKLFLAFKKNKNKNIVLCDLIGGTPFKSAMEIKLTEKVENIHIVAGINLPGLLTGLLSKDSLEANDLVNEIVQEAKEGIKVF